MTIPNTKLIRKATDRRNPALTRGECDLLWQQANAAMHRPRGTEGAYTEAFAAVEALLCQADREDGQVVPDLLPDPVAVPLGAGLEGERLEMIRGFIDRVESLNHRVQRGWRSASSRRLLA